MKNCLLLKKVHVVYFVYIVHVVQIVLCCVVTHPGIITRRNRSGRAMGFDFGRFSIPLRFNLKKVHVVYFVYRVYVVQNVLC